MPGTHSPISRHLFTLDGMVLTSGGAKNLAKGQFTIVNSNKAGADGAVVVSNFAGQPDSTVYEMRVGNHKLPLGLRNAMNSKPKSSHLFTIKDIVKIEANFPKFIEQTFDDLLIGYDGINADTAITLEEGSTTVLDILLTGEHLGFKTGQKEHLVKVHFGKEEGETDQEVFQRVVKNLQSQRLPGDVPLTELIDIRLVDSSVDGLAGVPYVFSTLTVTDGGDSNDLAKVQAQYPEYKVVVKARSGMQTTYEILHPSADALAAYSLTTSPMYIKGCEDCIAGYTEIEGGFVYSMSIEDDGADLSTTVDNLPGYVSGTILRHGNKDGKGLYTLVTDDKVTDAEIATYVGTAGVQSTAQIKLLGEVGDVCADSDTVTTAWVAGDTCYAQTQSYNIQLRDNNCGESRLAELQAAYPELTIVEGAANGEASQTITLTGTSGTANITVDGVAYTATFATSLTQTAANFVSANSAALTARGITVTNNAAVLTFEGQGNMFPATIANATGTLAGTASAVTYEVAASVGGCQRVYSTQVITNVVCEECDPIYAEEFISEAPQDFDFTSWELVTPVANEDALMGIRLTGKPFIFYPDDYSRDMVPFYETSTRIWVAGGYVEDENESFEPIYRDIFNVKRLSRAQDRDNLGAHLMQWEDQSMAYFDGMERHKKNEFARVVLGEQSVLSFTDQYISFSITIQDTKYSQSAGGRSDIGITYSIWAPLGQHEALQTYVNSLAARAGMEAVRPANADFA